MTHWGLWVPKHEVWLRKVGFFRFLQQGVQGADTEPCLIGLVLEWESASGGLKYPWGRSFENGWGFYYSPVYMKH